MQCGEHRQRRLVGAKVGGMEGCAAAHPQVVEAARHLLEEITKVLGGRVGAASTVTLSSPSSVRAVRSTRAVSA